MIALVIAIAAGYGVHLLYTSVALGWRGLGPGPAGRLVARATIRRSWRQRAEDWLAQAGLGEVGHG